MFDFLPGGHLPPPAGPAHWSTTVTVTPECRSQLRNGSNQRNGNGFSSRFTSGATELHRQITIPSQHMNGNGHQNGNGHGKYTQTKYLGLEALQGTIVHLHNLIFVVAQLNRRENQPDRMTMIAIADGNQVHNFLTSFILTKQIFQNGRKNFGLAYIMCYRLHCQVTKRHYEIPTQLLQQQKHQVQQLMQSEMEQCREEAKLIIELIGIQN